jgi:hypothetical protein
MFEITGDDVSLLNDEDLRALIGRLCEAELRRCGHSVSHAAWGGNQTAQDGGLDVHVSLPTGAEIEGFIPKPETGFQVKKPDMPRKAIIDEMKPDGVLRPGILELAKASGAYIIASSMASTAFSALKRRKEAMVEALEGSDASKLTVDFYDRNRIATWVRDHPGLIPWVRSLVGKSVPGWQSFGSWSRAPAGAADSYLFDDEARIKTGEKDEGDGRNAVDGINRIRAALREPRHVVRLVGLSGVGKTRLCEALFDAKIGKDSLDPSLAIYTHVAEGPNPPPVGLASDLIAGRTRAILVIDNCPFELHRQLTDVARAGNSTLSVVTVEYDIRDDQPEGTDVFALDSSSLTLIELLVQRRYPEISQIDARTIAEFSGGNARVALALAATVGKNEFIAGLSDADLFKRLFQQRQEHDPDLLLIAQACSLVYSFEGVKTKGESAELPVLAGLGGKSVQEVYAAVAELKRRDLLQERAEWRAVLPHAIANRLALLALQNIPADAIRDSLVTNAPARLRRSFSRRLGYLDESKEARAIVEVWLAPGGMLADVANLGEDERAMFANVTPVVPDAALTAIEHTFQGADEATLKKSTHLARLLRSLAYDPAQFERAVALLIKLTQVSDTDEARDGEPLSILTSLFHIVLSGTHAPVAMRLKVLQGLLWSNDVGLRAMGVNALRAMLKTDHFSSSYGFEFGARSRDYGYHPRTGKDVKEWFDAVMALACPLALSDSPVAPQVRKCIAGEFRGLWAKAGQTNALQSLSKQIVAKGFWREGWIAARQARIFAAKDMPVDVLGRLTALEELLRPKDLADRVRGVVLGLGGGVVDLDEIERIETEDFAGAAARMNFTVKDLGKDVATDDDAFKTLLPSLVRGGSRVRLFGESLASSTEKPYEVWQALLTEFTVTDRPDASIIGGFLNGVQKRDAGLADKLLDEALEHPSAGPRFPELQASVTIEEQGVKRLHRALDVGMAPISQFYALAYGQASDNIPGAAFRDLLLAIASKPGGNIVALEILSMRLFSDASHKRQSAPEATEAGCALLDAYEFRKRDGRADREDHELGRIAQASLKGEDGIPIVRRIVRDMMAAINRYDIYANNQDDLMASLLRVHPTVVLDEMFSGDAKAQRKAAQTFLDLLALRKSPLDVVPDETLLEWCDRVPAVRYTLIAASATLFKRPANDKPHEWTLLASQLLAKAPDARAVFEEIVRRLHPTGWSGSLATKLESRLKLLEQLALGDTPGLAEAFNEAKALLQHRITAERKREADEDRNRSGRFE